MPKSRGKRGSQNKQAKDKLAAERAITVEAVRAAGAIESTGKSGLAPSTFAPCEKTAARLFLTPFPVYFQTNYKRTPIFTLVGSFSEEFIPYVFSIYPNIIFQKS